MSLISYWINFTPMKLHKYDLHQFTSAAFHVQEIRSQSADSKYAASVCTWMHPQCSPHIADTDWYLRQTISHIMPLTHAPETGSRNWCHKSDARFRRQFFMSMHEGSRWRWRSCIGTKKLALESGVEFRHSSDFWSQRVEHVSGALNALYSVSRKKRDQNVFGNISDKTRAIFMKFDTVSRINFL